MDCRCRRSVWCSRCGTHVSGAPPVGNPPACSCEQTHRGSLPKEFQGLMWIEARVRAIYSDTAAVAWIYQSSDPSQPTGFHGNTCAHGTNVDLTVVELPHAHPAQVYDMSHLSGSMVPLDFVVRSNFVSGTLYFARLTVKNVPT